MHKEANRSLHAYNQMVNSFISSVHAGMYDSQDIVDNKNDDSLTQLGI